MATRSVVATRLILVSPVMGTKYDVIGNSVNISSDQKHSDLTPCCSYVVVCDSLGIIVEEVYTQSMCDVASFPGPTHLFVACKIEKRETDSLVPYLSSCGHDVTDVHVHKLQNEKAKLHNVQLTTCSTLGTCMYAPPPPPPPPR